jgi:hypothetical protein
MDLIKGASLLEHPIHADDRGHLVAFQQFDTLPFRPERVFFMKIDRPEAERGGHANSCDEFIVAVAGAVRVEVDNGTERAGVWLRDYARGLWVRPGVLIHLRAFEPGTILLVCASARYEATHHFTTAQPHLMLADCCA